MDPAERIAFWTGGVSSLTAIAALAVAIAGGITANRQTALAFRQTELAAEQTALTKQALDFAREDAASNDASTRAALKLANRSASAAERQAGILRGSLDVARSGQETSNQVLQRTASSTLTQTRLEARRRYNEAYFRLDAAFQVAAAATAEVGVDLEEKPVLAALSLDQARQASRATKAMIAEFQAYNALVNVSIGFWTETLEAEIRHSIQDAAEAARCYLEAGNPPLQDSELPRKRAILLNVCAYLPAKWSDFRDASHQVSTNMLAESRQSLKDSGILLKVGTPNLHLKHKQS